MTLYPKAFIPFAGGYGPTTCECLITSSKNMCHPCRYIIGVHRAGAPFAPQI